MPRPLRPPLGWDTCNLHVPHTATPGASVRPIVSGLVASVRTVRPGDGPDLRELRLRALQTDPDAFAITYEQEMTRTDQDWTETVARSASADIETVMVAQGDDGFVGMAGAFTRDDSPKTRRLYGLWVAPEVRSQGIGRKLVDAITEWSATSGATDVTLWVVESNRAARRLYERAGFTPTGETQLMPEKPDLPEIRMRWLLD